LLYLLFNLISSLRPALQERSYRVSVLALKEGSSNVTLRFERRPTTHTSDPISGTSGLTSTTSTPAASFTTATADKKKLPVPTSNTSSTSSFQPIEYSFYKISIVSTPPKFSEPILLSTSVRTPTIHKLTISNPSSNIAHFSSSCLHPAVTVAPLIDVPGLSSRTVDVSFVPLDVMDSKVPLIFTSPQLGNIEYTLHLVALAAPSEKTIKFCTPIGIEQTQTFRFVNRCTQVTDFKITITADPPESSGAFKVATPTITSPAATSPSVGVEVAVPVTYDPSSLGMCRAVVTASSDKAGSFMCTLIGQATPPTPQGPISISANTAGVPISIRNVFNQQAVFTFQVDNPAFIVKASESIPGKKTSNVIVQYKPLTPPSSSGKMSVSCPLMPFTWIYYLKGI
jgi:hydrocephalus-inducing protein